MEQVLHNFYTENEMDRIWKEIYFLNSTDFGWVSPNPVKNATDENGVPLIQGAKQFDLSVLFDRYEYAMGTTKSNIYSLGKKICKWIEYLKNKHDVYYNLHAVNQHATFLNYYNQDNGIYKLHHDRSTYTMLSYFYEEPKNFIGGDLLVEDRKYEISNGFTIILPGWMQHGTTSIKIIDKTRTTSGRYSIANFFNIGTQSIKDNGLYAEIDCTFSQFFNIKHQLFDPTPIPVKE